MTDRELGKKLYNVWISECDKTHAEDCARMGRAARELVLADRTAATEEAVTEFCITWQAQQAIPPSYEAVAIAALRHFAPPEREKMMIEGMTEAQIWAEMANEKPRGPESYLSQYARVAHRLANTPAAPKVDPDAEAKRLALEHRKGAYPGSSRYVSPDDYWNHNYDDNKNTDELAAWRNGWRAVAAATRQPEDGQSK